MKKIFYLLSFTTFVFVGCNAGANAQNTTTATVGNPDSSNAVIIEQGYIATTAAQPVANPDAPLPAANQIQRTSDTVAPNLQPSNVDGGAVLESVTETDTPSSATIQVEEAVMPYNRN